VVARVVEPGSPQAESSPTGFGVSIIEADDDNRARLAALIDRVKAGAGPY
jgi:hypothetical protein